MRLAAGIFVIFMVLVFVTFLVSVALSARGTV